MTTDVCRWHITYAYDSQLDSVCAKPPQPTGYQGLYPGQRLKNTLYKHYSFSVFFFRVAARTDGLSSPFVLFFLLSIIFIAVFVTLGLTCTAGDGNRDDLNLLGDKISGCGSSWGIENDTLLLIRGRFLSSIRRRWSSVGFFAWACLRRFSGIPTDNVGPLLRRRCRLLLIRPTLLVYFLDFLIFLFFLLFAILLFIFLFPPIVLHLQRPGEILEVVFSDSTGLHGPIPRVILDTPLHIQPAGVTVHSMFPKERVKLEFRLNKKVMRHKNVLAPFRLAASFCFASFEEVFRNVASIEEKVGRKLNVFIFGDGGKIAVINVPVSWRLTIEEEGDHFNSTTTMNNINMLVSLQCQRLKNIFNPFPITMFSFTMTKSTLWMLNVKNTDIFNIKHSNNKRKNL